MDALDAFFELSPDLLCVRGADGYLQTLNAVWITTLGWSESELRSRPWSEFVHPSDLPATDELEQRCHQTRSGYVTYKNRWRARDGSYRWLQWRVSPYCDGCSYGIAQDVTQTTWQGNRNYLAQIAAAVKLRDRAIEASSVGIVIADATRPDMPLIFVNPAFEAITGYPPAEVLGYNCRFLQGKQTDQAELDRLRAAIRAGKDCTVTLRNYRKDGTLFWNELSISPIYDGEQLTHFVGVQADVTARIQAEKAVQLEKTRAERLLRNVLPQPIIQQLKEF
ncbi:MAG: PAS domain S-box protein, partial [Spirulinaceae cyanobacterium RM2_2_10]|nr:PAS domain S-box protein [Spirulinaceae cyanobacterium RM2_2_10]